MHFRFAPRLLAAALGFACIVTPALADPWSFAIVGDTSAAAAGPDAVTPMIEHLKQNFAHFVVHLGNQTIDGSPDGLESSLAFERALKDAGMGYYPVRGERESSAAVARRFQSVFPQTQGLSRNFGPATTFVSPLLPPGLTGLTYSFEYENTKFLVLDQFTRTDSSAGAADSATLDQLDWAASALAGKPAYHHGFVFAHRGLFGQARPNGLFGADPAAAPQAQNAFFKAMADNGVRYAFSGDDRMHSRSVLFSPDGRSLVQNIAVAADSLTFGTPAKTAHDASNNADFRREAPVAQELYHLGYYIVVVDHPRVTIEHYAALNGCGGHLGAGIECSRSPASSLEFVKRETFGYSLNGKEFVIQPGMSFVGIADSSPNGPDWMGTRMSILDGANRISRKLQDGRLAVQDINTGWSEFGAAGDQLKSDALTLWGMHNQLGAERGDQYTLSMSYHPAARGALSLIARGENGERDKVMSMHDQGAWGRAVDRNFGGQARFVVGPWKAGYGLSTYGVDPASHTVWAVLNRGGEFAVKESADGDLNGDGLIDRRDVAMIGRLAGKPASSLPAADVDGDGRITAADVHRLVSICTRPGCAVDGEEPAKRR